MKEGFGRIFTHGDESVGCRPTNALAVIVKRSGKMSDGEFVVSDRGETIGGSDALRLGFAELGT